MSFHGAEVRGMYPLTNPIARYLGDTSYTLYLWHWPVIILLMSVIAQGPTYYALTIGLSLGLTAVTYRFYENPIRKSDWLSERPATQGHRRLTSRRSAWGVVGGLGSAVIVLSILGLGYVERLSVAQQDLVSAQSNQSDDLGAAPQAEDFDPCFGAPAMLNQGCTLRNAEVPLQPSVDAFSKDFVPEARKCYTLQHADLATCSFGYMGDDAVRIALVGDSHATIVIPGLRQILLANKWQLTTYTGNGCVLMDPAPDKCRDMMAKTVDELLADPYDLVLVANYRYFNQDASTPEEIAVAYQSAWAPITAAGSRIAVLADNPESSEDAISCLTRITLGGDQTGDCGTSTGDAFRHPDPLVTAVQLAPGVTLIDLTPYYCKGDFCPSVIGNVIVYMDVNHITATFAETLARPLQDGLRRALDGAR